MDEVTSIRAKVIIEMIGAPKEHVEKTLRDYLDNLQDEITVLNEHIEPPVERDKLFATFAELELKFPTALKLIDFCFESMPSSIEIIEPEVLKIKTDGLSSFLNDLQARLHTVDMEMKKISAAKAVLDRNAMSVLHNFILFILKDGGKTAEDIAPLVGLQKEQVEKFLTNMVEGGTLSQDGNTYAAT